MNVNNSKIDEKVVKDHFVEAYYEFTDPADIHEKLDHLKIAQSILSRQLPPERYQGILNFCYIFSYPNATNEEINSVLVMIFNFHHSNTEKHQVKCKTDWNCLFRVICMELILLRPKHHSLRNFRTQVYFFIKYFQLLSIKKWHFQAHLSVPKYFDNTQF